MAPQISAEVTIGRVTRRKLHPSQNKSERKLTLTETLPPGTGRAETPDAAATCAPWNGVAPRPSPTNPNMIDDGANAFGRQNNVSPVVSRAG